MRNERFLAAAFLTGVLGIAASPAAAQYHEGASPRFERSHAPRHHGHAHPHSRRILPPERAYRDPRVDLRPRGRPDFLIHGYQPRFTETPIYNEPPPRFPQR